MRGSRKAAAVSTLVALAALAAEPARAQSPVKKPGTFSIDRFDPSPPGDSFASVKGGGIDGEELFRAGFTLDYARAPLVLRSSPAPLVEHQLVLHADLSRARWERVLVNMELPVVLLNQGNDVVRPGAPAVLLSAPTSANIGDIALGLRVIVLGARRDDARLAVGGEFWLPTGQPSEFVGDLRVRVLPHVSFGGAVRHFAYASHVGVMIQPTQDFVDVHLGPELRFGVAGAVVSSGGRVLLGPELSASAPFTRGDGGLAGLASAELLGSLRLRFGDLVVGAALGPGLIRGVGTPLFRSLATIAYAPAGEADSDHDGVIDLYDACPRMPGAPNEDRELDGCPPDRDGDGVLDVVDGCPDEPGVTSREPRRNGCPVPTDRDGDGIRDKIDACPDEPGPADPDPKKHGCPADRDGDGIRDAEDACPEKPGIDDVDPKKKGCPADSDGDGIPDAQDACPKAPGGPSADVARNGCPQDTDGDGVFDHVDACPRERGLADADQSKNGCPVFVRFGNGAIALLEPMYFAPASARISKAAEPVLREIANVMDDHPEVQKLVVEGAPGLGALRASAVVRWLSEHGVAASRLEARRVPKARDLTLRVAEPAPP